MNYKDENEKGQDVIINAQWAKYREDAETKMEPLYPLKFREALRHYGFGARWIAELFPKKRLPAEGIIAETWEVCDHGKDVSVVRNGPMAAMNLHELVEQYGAELLGSEVMEKTGGRFPLIIKFLDATNELSPQVHPDDDIAPKDEVEKTGKTEAWYVLKAKPGAKVYCGLKAGIDKWHLQTAMRTGQHYEALKAHEVKTGDMVFVPAGAVHASTGGILIYEIMQNCDTTYCFPRKSGRGSEESLKVERARRRFLDAVHFEKDAEYVTKPAAVDAGKNKRTFLLACRYFAVERLDLEARFEGLLDGRRFEVLSCISGGGKVVTETGAETIEKGESLLLPASIGGFAIEPEKEASLVRAYVSDLRKDVVEPLAEEGRSREEILGLGGRGGFNDLEAVLE